MSGFPTIGPGDDVEPLILDHRWLNGCSAAIAATSVGSAPADLPDGFERRPFLCKIKNNSGADVGRYGILGVDGPLIDKTANEKYFLSSELQFKGVKPKAEHAGRTAHCIGPIKSGKIGYAIIPSAVQCQVEIVDEAHRMASIVDDDLVKLKSGASGQYPMIPAETGTGVKWALVFLSGGRTGGLNLGLGVVDLQMCLICGEVPAASTGIAMGGGSITGLTRSHGFSETECVYPMVAPSEGVPSAPPDFTNDVWPEGHPQEGEIMKMKGANYSQEYPIRGGNRQATGDGQYNDPPIWGLGYQAEMEGETEEEKVPYFAILKVVDEVEIVRGLSVGAITTVMSSMAADGLQQLAGPRSPNRTKVSGVEIPYPVDSDDNAYCLIVRDKLTGERLLIDLACPEEE